MAMLAESRSRQKWSDDPRNTRWANDKSKFGYQMMTKMGWTEGKGLGQKEAGRISHVKVKKKNNNSGIGSKHSHDDDWISHQNDFNDLLSALNNGTGTESSIKSLEDSVKSSKKKILYTKFVKSKDLSNASSHDLACIFGTRSKSAPVTPNLSDDEGNNSDASAASCPPAANHITEHGFTTVSTGVSVSDYFAKKMATLKNTQENKQEPQPNITSDHSENEVITTVVKKKKSKKSLNIVDNNFENNSDSDIMDYEHVKKKKKKRKRDEENYSESKATDDVDHLTSKKKKKKKKMETEQTELSEETVDKVDIDNIEKVKKKKKKKKKYNDNT